MGRGETPGKLPNRLVKQYQYKPETFMPYLKELVESSKQTLRQISLAAGLDHAAMQRYIKRGSKPSQDACIALADYFGIHPNVVLEKAGYAPRASFDLSLADPNEFPPEVKEIALELMEIEDTDMRRRVCGAVLQLVKEMFTQIESKEQEAG